MCKSRGFNYRPARFDDEVAVKTWIERAATRMVTFAYEMKIAETCLQLATGYTRHVFVSREMRPAHLPKKYHAMFGPARESA